MSGRTVQLDKIAESSWSGQRKGTIEVILEFPTTTDTKASTWDIETTVELAAELYRLENSYRPSGYADEILLKQTMNL